MQNKTELGAKRIILALSLIVGVFVAVFICIFVVSDDSAKTDELKHEHLFENWLVSSEPTCEKDGKRICVCECEEEVSEVIPKLGHDFIVNPEKAPSCTQVGWKEFNTCSRCDFCDKVEIEPLDHDFVYVDMKLSTCDEDGNYAYKYCSRCDFSDIEILASHGHDYGDWIDVIAPTCLESGLSVRICKYNIRHVDVKISTTSHIAGEWVVEEEATCIENGKKHTECIFCGTTLETCEIEKTNHKLGLWKETVAPTCSSVGQEKRACANDCGYFESREIEKLAHVESEWIIKTESTCVSLGAKYIECTKCKTLLKEETVEYGSHNFGDWITITQSTCTHVGLQKRVCKNDADHYETKEIEKRSHQSGEWTVITELTCIKVGIRTKKCKKCDTTLEEEILQTIDHDWEVSGGKLVCSVCHAERPVENTGCEHDWQDNVCSKCGTDGGGTKNLTWRKDGGFYTLTGVESVSESAIVIPSIYNGLPVRSIACLSFVSNDITSIVVPESVTSIAQGAFEMCTNLSIITLPFIGAEYFATDNTHFGYIFGASNYEENNNFVPESLKTVIITGVDGNAKFAAHSFYSCESIERISINCSAEFGKEAFYMCSGLQYINIPSGVTELPESLFNQCVSLKEIVIPESVVKIGSLVFWGNTSLNKVEFENSSGWKANGETVDVSNPSVAAELLTKYDKYVLYEWLKQL